MGKWEVTEVQDDYVALRASTITGSVLIGEDGSVVAMIPVETFNEVFKLLGKKRRRRWGHLRSLYASKEEMARSSNPVHRAAAAVGAETLTQLADVVGVSYSALAKFANGTQLPSPTSIKAIAEATGDPLSLVATQMFELYESRNGNGASASA